MEDKKIYILLSDTGTLLTNVIKRYTKAPYNHASIAFHPDLSEVYSFGRKEPGNPWIGGFVKENINCGLYKLKPDTTCAVYSLTVSNDAYHKMLICIQDFERNKNDYKYNFIGLFGVALNMTIDRSHAYFCSQFVATVLNSGGIEIVDKPACFTTPNDFRDIPIFTLEFEGELRYYNPLKVHGHESSYLSEAHNNRAMTRRQDKTRNSLYA